METPNLNNGTLNGRGKLVAIIVLVVLACGAAFYFLNVGGLKGQIKLDQGKATCVRIVKLNKDKVKVAECYKTYPELLGKTTLDVQSKPVVTETASAIKYGFDNQPFKIVQLLVAPKPFTPEQSLNMTTASQEPQPFYKQVYYDKSDQEVTASVMYVLPSYNDPDMPPQISLPVALELCISSGKCVVVKQLSLSLAGSSVLNSGSINFTRGELAEIVEFLGLNSSEVVKFRLSVKESPNNSVIYTDYSEAQIVKVQK